jgi:hypothetical protein
MFANEYNSEEEGVFLRPVISFQPVIELVERISLIPYAGIGTRISFWSEYWEDTGDYIFNGYNLPSEKTSDEDSGTVFSGIETFLGFDVGIKIGAANNYQLTIGGVLTTLFGKNDSDFSEIHVVCSIPLN